jgi:hypothetical protein
LIEQSKRHRTSISSPASTSNEQQRKRSFSSTSEIISSTKTMFSNILKDVQSSKKAKWEKDIKEYMTSLEQNVIIESSSVSIEKDLFTSVPKKENPSIKEKLQQELNKASLPIDIPQLPHSTKTSQLIKECNNLLNQLNDIEQEVKIKVYELGMKLQILKDQCKDESIGFLEFVNKYIICKSLSQLNKYISFYSFAKKYPQILQCSMSFTTIVCNNKTLNELLKK